MRRELISKPFNLPLLIDPLRLLLGVRQHWWLLLLLPLVLGGSGAIYGRRFLESRYSVTLQLIRTEVPNMVQTSIEGQAFAPRQLSNDTLLAATYASDVLRSTGAQLEPARSAGEVRAQIEIAQGGDTDFFYLTAHSRRSAEDALAMVQTWASEIIRFTRGLQQQEARDIANFIQNQLSNINRQLEDIEQQMLQFTIDEDIIDPDKQITSTLGALESLLQEQVTAQTQLQAKEVQINHYREELRAQSPLQDELKRKREQLTFLRGRYTDANPMVQEKLYEIQFLEEQLAAQEEAGVEDLKAYTGGALGNNLYLEILTLEAERVELEGRVASLQPLIDARRAELSSLPEKRLQLASLEQQRGQLLVAQGLLDARLKEAGFFVTNAPGYWKVFHEPNIDDVGVTSKNTKLLLLTVAGAGGGFLLALGIACLGEFWRPGLRTPLEAAATTRAFPRLQIATTQDGRRSLLDRFFPPPDVRAANHAAARKFWLSHVSTEHKPYPAILFVPLGQVSGAPIFFEALESVMQEDLARCAWVHRQQGQNGSPVFRAASAPDNAATIFFKGRPLLEANDPDLIFEAKQQHYVMGLATGRPRPPDLDWISAFDDIYYLLEPTSARRSPLAEATHFCEEVLGPCRGVILIDTQTQRLVPRLIETLENAFFVYWENRDNKPKASPGDT